jgi:hypothetical protein
MNNGIEKQNGKKIENGKLKLYEKDANANEK